MTRLIKFILLVGFIRLTYTFNLLNYFIRLLFIIFHLWSRSRFWYFTRLSYESISIRFIVIIFYFYFSSFIISSYYYVLLISKWMKFFPCFIKCFLFYIFSFQLVSQYTIILNVTNHLSFKLQSFKVYLILKLAVYWFYYYYISNGNNL